MQPHQSSKDSYPALFVQQLDPDSAGLVDAARQALTRPRFLSSKVPISPSSLGVSSLRLHFRKQGYPFYKGATQEPSE